MAILDYLGRLAEIKKPDGTPVIPNPTNSVINFGNAARITSLAESKATDLLKYGKSTVKPDTKTTAGSAVKNLPSLVRNPMEEFASVSVLWTLAVLTPQQFNNPKSYRTNDMSFAGDFFMNESTGQIQESSIIFSSGGRSDQYRTKTFFGAPEYFINNFQMNCIITASPSAGNSNATKFSFDIYEPYSMGLLLQSMQNAAVKAGYVSYLDNTPYLLRMDIQGYDELGRSIKSVKPKFFTLKLTSMKFSVNEGGSTYKVEAIPYNHAGMSDTTNITYSDLKISGSAKGGEYAGSVVDVLTQSPESLVSVLNRIEKKLKSDGKIGVPDQYDIQFPQTSSDFYSTAGKPPRDFKATANPKEAPQKSVSGSATTESDTSKEYPLNPIATASLGFDQLRGGNPLFKRADDKYDEKTGVIKRDGMTIDPKTRAFHFSQKTSLTAIINQIILSSDYAKKAIDPKNVTPEGYIKWFKLDVQIELLSYDAVVGDYAKKITFRVVPYFVHQSIFSNVNAAPVGYAELMKYVAKEYNYIYTGQNVDILKFDININNLFYTAANPKPESQSGSVANQDQNLSEKLPNKAKAGVGQAAAAQGTEAGRARTKKSGDQISAFRGGAENKTTEQLVAENFQKAFISGSSADMVTVDLEILGDPYWLVDSGIANYFSTAQSEKSQITNDGTMHYEAGNIYIYLTFRTPADINETKGTYDFSVAGKESPFGGIYRITSVENFFNDGFWKQKLKCLRMPGPQGPEVNSKKNGSAPVVISKEDAAATVVEETEKPKTSPTQNTTAETPSRPGNTGTATSNPGNTRATRTTRTTTTSNTAQTTAGFRYYRDLGQN